MINNNRYNKIMTMTVTDCDDDSYMKLIMKEVLRMKQIYSKAKKKKKL